MVVFDFTSQSRMAVVSPQLELNPDNVILTPDQTTSETVMQAIEGDFEVGRHQRDFVKLETRALDAHVSHAARMHREKSGYHDQRAPL
jgi:hypothetical protein